MTSALISYFYSRYGIDISNNPKTVEAKVLPLPRVFFGRQEVRVGNGSWNLLNVKFTRPADLVAFAVADFSGRRTGSNFISEFLPVARKHGMTTPLEDNLNLANIVQELQVSVEESRVTRGGLTVDTMEDTVNNAIEKAHFYFAGPYLR